MNTVIKIWVKIFSHFKNEHIPCENLFILVQFSLFSPLTNAAVEKVFPIANDFWRSEKSGLSIDTPQIAILVCSKFAADLHCDKCASVKQACSKLTQASKSP
ncbi:hypothetical protein AVEN_4525-1 [Araneus ventricosus]|uniref:HAT C-terminal dimerisation domain-containing protein n=1 Tax=Araneus ventricosus TaxID=182803 RepID=A0A4Y2BN19_ARAVE|nr:hypothetical protein AVEN_4525-1 [Araneus ventricosus]